MRVDNVDEQRKSELRLLCPAHSGLEERLALLEEDKKRQWEVIDRIGNRLPAWATLMVSVLTFLLGASLTYAGLATRLAQSH